MRALLSGGTTLNGIVARTSTLYDGVGISLRGTVRDAGGKVVAGGCFIEMNPKEALDLARELIKAAEKHGQQTQRQAAAMRQRLTRNNPK